MELGKPNLFLKDRYSARNVQYAVGKGIRRKSHVRFLGEKEGTIPPTYPTLKLVKGVHMEIIERGRSKIKLVGCLFIGSSLLTIILHNLRFQGRDIIAQMIRLSLTILLSYFMMKGNKIARVIAGILLVITITTLFISLATYTAYPIVMIVIIFMIMVYGYLAYCIILDKSVNAFYKNHNNNFNKEDT